MDEPVIRHSAKMLRVEIADLKLVVAKQAEDIERLSKLNAGLEYEVGVKDSMIRACNEDLSGPKDKAETERLRSQVVDLTKKVHESRWANEKEMWEETRKLHSENINLKEQVHVLRGRLGI